MDEYGTSVCIRGVGSPKQVEAGSNRWTHRTILGVARPGAWSLGNFAVVESGFWKCIINLRSKNLLLINRRDFQSQLIYIRQLRWEQGRREVVGGPGQIFLGAPISKFFQEKFFFPRTTTSPLFREKNFLDEFVAIAFQWLYLNFSYQIAVLCPPTKQISCPLRGNI